DWERTGGDKLFRSGRDRRAEWTHLQVASRDVARLWPFTTKIAGTDAQTDRQEIGDQDEGPFILLSEQEPAGREEKISWQSLPARWPDGRVPATIKTSEAMSIVNAWIRRRRATLEFKTVSRETVARVLSRK